MRTFFTFLTFFGLAFFTFLRGLDFAGFLTFLTFFIVLPCFFFVVGFGAFAFLVFRF